MRSSGIKRGLAALAVSAVAVVGIPALAMADTIDSQVTDSEGPTDVQLYNTTAGTPDMTIENDGTDTTVRLEAGGGENVLNVTFQVRRDPSPIWSDIATVGRNDDGAFSYEWTPEDNGVFPGDQFDLRAVNANDITETDTENNFRLRLSTADEVHAINIAAGEQKGYFENPCLDDEFFLGVVGTTSVTSTDPSDAPLVSWRDGAGNAQGTTWASSNSGDGTFEAVLEFTDPPYNLDDPNLPPAEADQMVVRARTDANVTPLTDRDTDDFEAYTLYQQTLTSVTATLTPATEPDPGTVTITALDQNSQPIANIEIRRDNGTVVGFTNGRGQITVAQNDNDRYYYANADCNGGFSPAAGDKRSNDVNNRAAVVNIVTTPSEGAQPIGTSVTETITVTDTNGDPISNRNVRIIRNGPGSQAETVFMTTNDSGQISYTFSCNVAGVANIDVGITGPVPPTADPYSWAMAHDAVTCGQDDNVTPNPSKVNAHLSGVSKGNRDVLRLHVTPSGKAKGAVVRVQKRMNGKWVAWANTKELNKNDSQAWSFKDGNGNRVSKYRVIVGATENSRRDVSNVVRLR
jgi:hypothetical protein